MKDEFENGFLDYWIGGLLTHQLCINQKSIYPSIHSSI